MDVIADYSTGTLYDCTEELYKMLKQVVSRFPDDRLRVVNHPTYMEVSTPRLRLPWLFYSEFSKASRMLNAEIGLELTFAAVEVGQHKCFINKFCLL